MKGNPTHQLNTEKSGDLTRSEESKQRILLAGTAIFAQKGLEGSRVDEIADEAKINKRMIYHYFGSKENLYVEVLRYNYTKLYARGSSVIQSGADPETVIKQAIREYFYYLAAHDEFVRLMSWEALNQEKYANRVLPQLIDPAEPVLRQFLQEGQLAGLIRKNIDIRHLLVSVNALCLVYFSRREMLQTFWKEDMMAPSMLEERLIHIQDIIFNGILKHGEEEM
ncbi:TetR/AcrR family transcriptional regulator [Desulfosporosinus hippei]|uniref:Transcriptional regulator, TetR family n=1 Tax=Desulfosporosinus hippei DSM 8344 TaxID=1121419 RepID=A0A1G7V6Z4_9FIRM|nr:TetR/AcrR family transcriptional regulator [Desulfosporosinus hippei]SDG55358.1 transcriptional regulator, TetR family [Desulfosporosinus hippei DSM 8344]